MEDFIELGLEAMDTGIDKGFHKIPSNKLPSRKMFHRGSKDKSASQSDPQPRSQERTRRDSSPQYSSDEYEPRDRRYDDGRDRGGRDAGASDGRRDGGASDGRRDAGASEGRRSSGRSRRDDEPPYNDNRRGEGGYADDRDRSSRRDNDDDGARSRDPRDGEYYPSTYYTPQTGMLAYGGGSSTDRSARPSSAYTREYDYPYNAPYDPGVRYPTPPYGDNYGEGASSRRSRSTAGQRRGGRPDLKQRSSSVDRSGGGENALQKVFTNSDKGLGIGMLGAVAGGLLAQEAGLRRGKNSSKSGKGSKGGLGGKIGDPIVLTLLGAAIGGLGANALEKRFAERGSGKRRDSYDEDARDGERERARDRDGDRDRDRDYDRDYDRRRSDRD